VPGRRRATTTERSASMMRCPKRNLDDVVILAEMLGYFVLLGVAALGVVVLWRLT
jgi:hypothetical protein